MSGPMKDNSMIILMATPRLCKIINITAYYSTHITVNISYMSLYSITTKSLLSQCSCSIYSSLNAVAITHTVTVVTV